MKKNMIKQKVSIIFHAQNNSKFFVFLDENQQSIIDQTNKNLVILRHKLYLRIQSSVRVEECVRKLLQMNIPAGQEVCFLYIKEEYLFMIKSNL
jgi:hypothetical protein